MIKISTFTAGLPKGQKTTQGFYCGCSLPDGVWMSEIQQFHFNVAESLILNS